MKLKPKCKEIGQDQKYKESYRRKNGDITALFYCYSKFEINPETNKSN
jgi:hypothetical protein